MPRIVSVWLRHWPVHRWHAAAARRPSCARLDPEAPFVLADRTDTPRITAVDARAEAYGLTVGETLADARARVGALEVRLADPAADTKALARLARWATRYTPSVAVFKEESGSDGFFLDVTGASHLQGGEDKLLADLARRLAAFGVPARLALAETPGTAWAASHFARAQRIIVSPDRKADTLTPLPVEALRLAPDTARTLRRLGFKRIGDLIGKPRAPFAARFEAEVLRRLDQALGRSPEPLTLLAPLPLYEKSHSLLEPITTEEAIVAVAIRLVEDLLPALEADGAGIRSFTLHLYRVDGQTQQLDVGLAQPTQSAEHIARLLRLKLERMSRLIEAGYGFETLRLAVTVAARMEASQHTLAPASEDAARTKRCSLLADALRQRLGPASVRHLLPVASHIPERSERLAAGPQAAGSTPWPARESACPRPPLLLPRAEPASVTALVPYGPPQRVQWRGNTHTVTHAEGPERIAAEWWLNGADAPMRDYYIVENEHGHRLWLYREVMPGREATAHPWFVHGFLP